jgi:CRP-like cAMP-binding protein
MEDQSNAMRLFRRLLSPDNPGAEAPAADALRMAARDSEWRRNQPCGTVVAGGRIGCVLSGAVRKYSVRANGQRQIIDLLVRGDFLGLTASDPCFSLEAVSNGTRIACFRRQDMQALTEVHPAISELIRNRAADAIRRLENHLLIQGRTTAKEKVGGYLAAMCRRIARDQSGALVLPISRYDIADHLGLAVETVSRTMTALRRGGSIALPSPRHVEIRDTAMLMDGAN